MFRFSMIRQVATLLVVFFTMLTITMQISASSQTDQPIATPTQSVSTKDEETATEGVVGEGAIEVDSKAKFQEETPEELLIKLNLEAATAGSTTANETAEIEEKEQVKVDPRVTTLNGLSLSSRSPQSQDLNIYLNSIMEGLITDNMSTYEKLWVCYDFIADTTRYGSHTSRLSTVIGNTTCRAISKEYGTVEGYGAVALATKTGLCNAYSAAFILMANEIGLNAYMVKGYTRSAWGGYVYHEWAEVNIGGSLYVFDPQLDQSLERAGFSEGSMFMRLYSETSGRYSKS